ncbi:glycosyltransferase family 2 protein [Sphingomonas abietis]|uniref:Glycosyltransferase family 2 protein n=1 Tax=Sphingomonas abietis TaxID=3012344 RepID=A0ABY7NIK2_9SPHN|nr:glycosyltransferase family 2 protein [Sphingomonas abietis]WBO20825.1 glycosyltransferase family 2 protein [Sphingomonas abietis]
MTEAGGISPGAGAQDADASAALSVSIVIPTWNSSATLPRALASITDPGAGIEIIVVDDQSDDRASLHAIVEADARVILIVKPERTNAAHSRAIGLERATGDVVLFLDSDDHYLPGHIARRRALHAATGASVVVGRFRLNDGRREWDGPMSAYEGGSIEAYLFARGGDARSSTLSVARAALRGTTFDARLAKHQDWGFALAACRNGERIAFDPDAGAVISIAGGARMSARSHVEASLGFARDHLTQEAHRRRFLIGRLRTSLRLGDIGAARRFRAALMPLHPSPRERWGSAAMIVAAGLGIAAPLHRLLTRRR